MLVVILCLCVQEESGAEAGCCVGAEGWTAVDRGECVGAGQENPGALEAAAEEWTEEGSEEEAVADPRWTAARGEGWDQERWT